MSFYNKVKVKKQYLFIAFLFVCNLSSYGRDYYVSSSEGFSTNSGLSALEPIRDIPSVKEGDRLFLKAGDVFYCQLSLNKNIVLRYGEGSNPVLCGYKRIKEPNWEKVSNNIWRTSLSDTNYTGFVTGSSLLNNIGCIHDYKNDVLHGKKVSSKAELKKDWDIWQSDDHSSSVKAEAFDSLYLYLSDNPNHFKLEFSVGGAAVRMFSSTLERINIEGFGFGISAFSNCYIRGCKIDAIGGMVQIGRPEFVCFGNGIEFYVPGIIENSLVENCYIRRCYDSACTIQGSGHDGAYPRNIVFKKNLIEKCCQGWEDFLNNGDCFFENCCFDNNIVIYGDTEFSYSSTSVRYCHVLGNNWTGNRGMVLKDNTFIGGNLYRSGEYEGDYKSNVWKGNKFYTTLGRYLLCNYLGTKDYLSIKNSNDLKTVLLTYRGRTSDQTTEVRVKSQRLIDRKAKKAIRTFKKQNGF